MSEIVLGIRLTADNTGLVGTVRLSAEELNKLAGAEKNVASAGHDAAKATEEFAKKTEQSNQLTQRFTRNITGMVASYASLRTVMHLVSEYRREEIAAQKLDNTIASMQRSTKGLSSELRALAGQLQREGIIGDEAIMEGQVILAIYGKITDSLLPRTVRVMADLAAFMGGDVTSAARALGMASEGSTDQLRRQGIVISDVAKASGDFNIILDEVTKKVGGTNTSVSEGGGIFEKYGNRISDVKEKLGELIALNPTFRAFAGGIVSSVEWMVSAFINLGANTAKALGAGVGGEYFDLSATQLADKQKELTQQLAAMESRKPASGRDPGMGANAAAIRDLEARLAHVNLLLSNVGSTAKEALGSGGSITVPDDVLTQYGTLSEQLARQNALYGDVTNVARVKYEIENTGLKELNAQQKQYLISQAEMLDAKDAEKKAIEDLIESEKKRARQNEKNWQEVKKINEQFKNDSDDLTQFIANQHEKASEKLHAQLEAQAEREAEILQQPIKNALDGMQGSVTDFWVSLFNGGINTFKDLGNALKQIFIRMFAELATLKLFQPMVGGMLSAMGGGAMASTLGMSGGGGIMGGLGGMLGSLGTSLGFGTGATSVTGLGGELLGTIPGKVGSMTGASLGSFLGAAGMGAMGGGMLANLLGLNKTGGSVGGGIGAAAGMFLGGPVGALIGGGLGSIAGGFFGGGKSNGTQAIGVEGTGQLSAWGFTGKKLDPALRSAADNIGQQLQQSVAAITEAVGGQLAGKLAVEIGSRDASKVTLGSQSIRTRQGDSNAALQAALGLAVNNISGGDNDLVSLLQSTFASTGDLNQALAAVQAQKQAQQQAAEAQAQLTAEADAFRKSLVDTLSPLDTVTSHFDEMRQTAERLGVGLSEVNNMHLRALQELQTQTQGQLTGLVDRARSMYSIDQLSGYRDSLSTSSFSPLSAQDRLRESRRQLDDLFSRAQGGDLDAARQFSGLAQQTLTLGREVGASGSQFQDLFRSVNMQLNQVISTQQDQFNAAFGPALEFAIKETSADQILELKKQTTELVAELQSIRRELQKALAA